MRLRHKPQTITEVRLLVVDPGPGLCDSLYDGPPGELSVAYVES